MLEWVGLLEALEARTYRRSCGQQQPIDIALELTISCKGILLN